jgi:exodeoxyribonuclease VIII
MMTNDEYHADRHYFSSSQIKQALISPAHFKAFVLDKKSKTKSSTSMEFGSLVHTIVLEPHTFDDQYIVYSGDTNKDGSLPKAAHTTLTNKHPLHTPVSKQHYELACLARQNFEKHPEAAKLLFDKQCEYEVSYFNQCQETGLRLRVRPDCINVSGAYIIDLKTSSAGDKNGFKKDAIYNYHYDLSAFMYLMTVYQLTGVECSFYFAVAFKDELMPAYMFKASKEFIESGKAKFFKACDNIRTALTLNDDYVFQEKIEEI